MTGPIRAKKVNCSTCLKPYASLKNLAKHTEKEHKNTENNGLNIEDSVLESAAAEADDEEQAAANLEDDDFEDINQEEPYTPKEKETAKKVFLLKLRATDQQKGLLRKFLKSTEQEITKYKNDLIQLVNENVK